MQFIYYVYAISAWSTRWRRLWKTPLSHIFFVRFLSISWTTLLFITVSFTTSYYAIINLLCNIFQSVFVQNEIFSHYIYVFMLCVFKSNENLSISLNVKNVFLNWFNRCISGKIYKHLWVINIIYFSLHMLNWNCTTHMARITQNVPDYSGLSQKIFSLNQAM